MSTSLMSTTMSRVDRSRRTAELLAAAAACGVEERAALQDEVVLLNRRIADAVASRYRDRGVPLEDLQQAAYEGLVKAVRRFDPAQSDDLLTFAVPTIRGEVQRHFRDRSWMVRPPRRLQELQTQVNHAVSTLHELLGREPSRSEICEHVGIDAAEYAEVIGAFGCFSPVSLDRRLGAEGGGAAVGELIADPHEGYLPVEARCLVESAVRGLGDPDRRLLHLLFAEEWSQREVGETMGLSQAQVSRRLQRLLHELRGRVDA